MKKQQVATRARKLTSTELAAVSGGVKWAAEDVADKAGDNSTSTTTTTTKP
jgi:hypothetical protein